MVTLAAVITLIVLALLTAFQVALVFGAPLGRFAWGGQHKGVLPRKLRIASIFSIVIYGVFALFVFGKLDIFVINPPILSVGLWVFTAYFILGTIMNAVSRSKYERYTMTPIAAVLAVCFLVLVIG